MSDPIRVSGIVSESIVDGPGLRFVLFVQGCEMNCPGCHNPATHDKNGGFLMTADEIMEKIAANPLIDGVTFSGGEPFLQAEKLVPLAEKIKAAGLDLIVYSGYRYEELKTRPGAEKLLALADTLIDGQFIESEKSLELRFMGSRNQRTIALHP
ncbi:MAG: anaerobic ribonucleoside-triphosphate reductase activating protein [Ruminococcus sp.]|jgi:anaerobic ribonucleoside-triphosphate reductase activating protein|nr:anaerobic ribonucleoside-triphosphate reductase activating protein [Ruminococcus sp.]